MTALTILPTTFFNLVFRSLVRKLLSIISKSTTSINYVVLENIAPDYSISPKYIICA